jgi:hypothetical protein
MKILKHLVPSPIRYKLIRRALRFHPIEDMDFQVGIATRQDEMEQSFRLLHESYLSSGLINRRSSGLYCNIYNAFPHSILIVAKIGEEVVGTASLIKDSPLGLLADADYLDDDNRHRHNGHRLCEGSSLAVDSRYRGSGRKVSFALLKYLFHYAKDYMDATHAIAVTRPNAEDTYRAIFNFQRNGPKRLDSFIHLEVVNLILDCTSLDRWMRETYPRNGSAKDFAAYFLERNDINLRFPERSNGIAPGPVMTPELLDYFFVQKSDVFRNATQAQLGLVRSAYEPFYDLSEKIPLFSGIEN